MKHIESARNVLAGMVDGVLEYDPGRAARTLDGLLRRADPKARRRVKMMLMDLLAEIGELDPEAAETSSIREEAHALIEEAARLAPKPSPAGRGGTPSARWWVALGALGTMLAALAMFGPR